MKCGQLAISIMLLLGAPVPALATVAQVTIMGGEQQTAAGIFDSGTFSLVVGGYTETISYGKFSTNASIASDVAAKFSLDCNSPVMAHASGTNIFFETRNPTDAIGNIAAISAWDQNDFQLASFAVNATSVQPPSLASTIICFPGTVISGENVTCAVTLAAGASSPVTLSIAGNLWTTASPNASGVAISNETLVEPSSGAYTISYAYPGDMSVSIPAASGSFSVTVDMPGTQVGGNPIYEFQLVKPGGVVGSGYDPAGNIVGYNDLVNGAWSLSYDNLNRLVSSIEAPANGGPQYGCWEYDSFGNMLTQAVSSQAITAASNSCQTQSGANNLQSSYRYGSNNQITSGSWLDVNKNTHTGTPQYDSAGDMKNDLLNTYLYDAEGRVCAVNTGGSITGYLYNPEGQRVAKGILQNMTCDPTQLQVTAAYFIGPDGETMTEVDGQGNRVRTEISAAGMHLATYTSTGFHYLISDWLGTKRVVFNPSFLSNNNNGIEESCVSNPFGDGLNCSTSLDASPRHFTGKERDAESGLDYFGARYYGSNMGRFMSPDWSATADPVPYARMDDPQSLNLYSYVEDNPLRSRDLEGHTHQECSRNSSTSTDSAGMIHVTVTEHCVDVSDFSLFAMAIPMGHHFIPQSISRNWNDLSRSLANRITSGPLVDKWRNYYDSLHRAYSVKVKAIVDDYLEETGKTAEQLSVSDVKAIIQRIKDAGGAVQDFSSRLAKDASPTLRNAGQALENGLQESGLNDTINSVQNAVGDPVSTVEEIIQACESGGCPPP